jgi:O-antigen/teichoic acid export membrane protein
MLILRRASVFDPSRMADDLARKSMRGGAVTLAAQASMFVLQILGTLILARLLTPADFGLISMVAVLINLGQLFREAGLSTATIQQERITPEQVSTLFWANAMFSVVLGLVLLACAPLVALFYHEPALAGVTAALAVSFTLGGLANQHVALLQRNLFFRATAVIQVAPQAAYLVTATILALVGWRYWALVGGTIVQAAFTLLLAYTLCRWLPGRPRRGVGAGSMLKFGGNVLGFNVANYFSRNLDNILIGRYLGPAPLGLYAKAYSLFMMPITQIRSPIMQVALPVLSSLRNEPERYVKYYHRILSVMSFLTVPLTLLCAFEAGFLIRVLLGPQWVAAVPVFRILAITALVQPIASTRGLVMLTHGFSRRYFHWGVINAVVVCGAFFAGLPYGINGVAAAYAVANYAVLMPSLWYCFRGTPVNIGGFLKAMVPSLAVGVVASSVFALELVNTSDSAAVHLALSVGFLAIYAGLSLTLTSFRDTLRLLRAAWKTAA